MPPPCSLKEAQRLTRRITALSRFISRSFDRSLPFFKVLRRATRFQRDAECDQALEELKEYLNSLPVLAKPSAGEPLWIYLSSTDYAFGSALVKQNGHEQQPEDFLSHILKDVESCYTGLEKLAYALVLTGRRLRPYFLTHLIIVMTNNTLGRVLLDPEASGYYNILHRLTEEMKTSTVSCLFDQWGTDIVGSFPMATDQRRFLLVAVDYFSKWMEADPLARISEQMIIKFIRQNILCRFGIPHWLISDNGRQFAGRRLREWFEVYGI
ncbi:uncharacterized protein LOC121979709 [Zingiber officinale]|uniref:uncharacterized protein LOC121979709 n=1 Tax=Zingiber officinale TaxID=94328 RepID=UPI001C4D9B63|nr:uncharacterized protein LOC121979709 [Zingiber officinale]